MPFKVSVSFPLLCLISIGMPSLATMAQDGETPGIKPAAIATVQSDEDVLKTVSQFLLFTQISQLKGQLVNDGLELDRDSALEGVRRAIAGEEVGVPFEKITSVMEQMQKKVLAIRASKAKGEEPETIDSELQKSASLLMLYNQIAQMKMQLKGDGIELNAESALEGGRRALSGEELGIEKADLDTAMGQMQKKVMAIRAEKQKAMKEEIMKLAATNKAEGEAYLAENAKKDGVKILDGGVQYEVMVEGKGPTPKPTDRVRINYHGMFVNGEVFDSTVAPVQPGRPPAPYDHVANGFVNGFNVALQSMPVGSKWKISLPSDQAYGMGRPGMMPPNKTLIFEVELLEILPAN